MNVRKFRFLRQKSLFGKLIRMPFRAIPSSAVLRIISGPLRGKKWIKGAHNLSIVLGTYEKNQSRLFVDSSKSTKVFWDLGAHVGYYSLLFRTSNPTGRIIAFEPMPSNAAFFRRHMDLNELDGADLFVMAVSDVAGELAFNTSRTSVAGKLATKGDVKVEVIKISTWLEEKRIPIPDLIKMDIEGEEHRVLKDIEHVLRKYRPRIFLSTHGDSVHRDCLSLLKAVGYDLKPLDTNNLETSRELMAF